MRESTVFLARRLAGCEEVVLVRELIGRSGVRLRPEFDQVARDEINRSIGMRLSGKAWRAYTAPGVSQAN